mgnify:CR=1 FL=1
MEDFLLNFGYLGVFIISFLSATLLPFSSDVVVATTTALNFNPVILLFVATIGNTLGGMTNYLIGYLGKEEWPKKYLKIKESKLNKAKNIVIKYSKLSAFFTWLPAIGDPIAIVLGFFKINPFYVFIFMFLGKGFRYAFIIFMVDIFKKILF